MPKFTLIAEHDSNGHKITYEFNVEHISAVLENIDYFIRGVGYNPEGTLDYVSDEEYYGTGTGPEWQTPEWDTPPEEFHQQHSDFYFDTERNK
jgi:hypothetical protein